MEEGQGCYCKRCLWNFCASGGGFIKKIQKKKKKKKAKGVKLIDHLWYTNVYHIGPWVSILSLFQLSFFPVQIHNDLIIRQNIMLCPLWFIYNKPLYL